jgi:hypothetical protein
MRSKKEQIMKPIKQLALLTTLLFITSIQAEPPNKSSLSINLPSLLISEARASTNVYASRRPTLFLRGMRASKSMPHQLALSTLEPKRLQKAHSKSVPSDLNKEVETERRQLSDTNNHRLSYQLVTKHPATATLHLVRQPTQAHPSLFIALSAQQHSPCQFTDALVEIFHKAFPRQLGIALLAHEVGTKGYITPQDAINQALHKTHKAMLKVYSERLTKSGYQAYVNGLNVSGVIGYKNHLFVLEVGQTNPAKTNAWSTGPRTVVIVEQGDKLLHNPLKDCKPTFNNDENIEIRLGQLNHNNPEACTFRPKASKHLKTFIHTIPIRGKSPITIAAVNLSTIAYSDAVNLVEQYTSQPAATAKQLLDQDKDALILTVGINGYLEPIKEPIKTLKKHPFKLKHWWTNLRHWWHDKRPNKHKYDAPNKARR